jgi:predicted RNase H-like nuclease
MERGGGERLVAVGADGARGGWAVACLYEAGTRLMLAGDIAAIARLRVDSAAPVAIDVPIGLPARGGPRPCDVAARRLLGRRASTVFAPPARYLLAAAGDYAAMRALAERERRTNPAAAGLSAQSAGIARKVREVDAWVHAHPESERWLFETHPELGFLALDAGRPLEAKRSPAGARRRLELVSAEFPDAAEQMAVAPGRGRRAGPSDWLDAYAALTAAVAVARGEHVTLGAECDTEGVPTRIVRPAVRPQISSFG